jgi:UDP:flavonoid glycosyltransferase YjiC (YdhE family)
VKIMATSCPDQAYLRPMLPTLSALRDAGHDVLLALPEKLARLAFFAGVPAMATIDGVDQGGLGRREANRGRGVADLLEHVLDCYVPAAELTVEATVRIAEIWRPDLIMCTDWEYAGPIAAARLGIPTALHGCGPLAPPELDTPVAEALLPLHRRWGLPRGLSGPWVVVDNCPPTLERTAPPLNAIPSTYVPCIGSDRLLEEPQSPRVLVTLGNDRFGGDRADTLRRTVHALLSFDLDVVVAGEHVSLDQWREVPQRVRVLRSMLPNHLAPTCEVVVHDGGAETTMSSTVAGVPQLVLPQTCVQYQHADRIAEVGAGRRLDPEEATTGAISDALACLLDNPGPRTVASVLAAEIAARPALDEVVEELTGALSLSREAADLWRAR